MRQNNQAWVLGIAKAQLAAVFDHKKLCRSGKKCRRCAEDREWVLADVVDYPWAFVECCHRVGEEPATVRRAFELVQNVHRLNKQEQCKEAA